MADLHTNGNYEAHLAQMFNPLAGGAQVNPAVYGGIGAGYGGLGAGTVPNMGNPMQQPWAGQNLPQMNAFWPQQQMQNPAQSLQAIQITQQIAARQAAQALQALQQCAQHLAALQWAQPGIGPQGAFGQGFGQGLGGGFGTGQFGGQFGQGFGHAHAFGLQHLINQLQQQQALQHLAQYLAAQQQAQYRYGLGF